jgi:hypothetical protein
MLRTKSVRPARVGPTREPRALFGQEAALLCVLFRAREIDLLVRGVEVPDDEYGARRRSA